MTMTRLQMLANLKNWFDKISKLLKNTSGSKHQVLYVDNPTGLFSFKTDSAVLALNIATTATEVAGAKASIEANPNKHGLQIINQLISSVEEWDVATSTWVVNKPLYSTYVMQSRYYYSPWNQTVWLTTPYGALQRFMTTGLTKIG